MAADLKKFAADYWKRGNEAFAKENWDYAIDCFTKSVEFAPDNLTYRQTLRGTVRKKYKDNKSGAKMASVKLMGVKGKIKKSRMQKDWKNVDKLAEEGLRVNPWDASLNAAVGEACLHLEYGEIAVFAYQRALETEMENVAYNRELARLLEDRGEYTEAIKLWERVKKLVPEDTEARSKITQIGA
ncbi:MAG: tetratricopeptide repeat protein, partial [Planctomycetota bacterium]|nr:tetratricopeptide repeat protein [Planctomycetota bacterium]